MTAKRLNDITIEEHAQTSGGRKILADAAHRYLTDKITVDRLPPEQPVKLPVWAVLRITQILKAIADAPSY